jgi:tetratricopeptide (TPR) repeat protein
MALRSREAPPADVYPEPANVEPARWRAAEQMARLRKLGADDRLVAARIAPEFHNWALCVEAAEESRRAASRDLKDAAVWAQVAVDAAERVKGPEGWRNRLQGMALAVDANVRRVEGQLKSARAGLCEAGPFWLAGSDPLQILDPALLLDLDASLCRAERRFGEALDRLEDALRVGRCPERYLVNKGSILAVMGEYERALEALLATEPDREAEPRLWYQHRFNVAVTCSHLERHAEAAGLLQEVRKVAAGLGDEIFLVRATWLEGRLAAGLGRTQEALGLLERARAEFAVRNMSYDVALALLETAALLLGEGRTAEVKALAPRLSELFTAKGIHREALVALRIFREAVEGETATADLARRVLRFLFRAQYDQGLRFSLG